MRQNERPVTWLEPLVLLLLAPMAGCSASRPGFALEPYDYRLSTTIIRQFFRDNPTGQCTVEVHVVPEIGRPSLHLPEDMETESWTLRALERDAVPEGDPLGWGVCPSPIYMYINGPHYSLYITIGHYGFALGSEQAYCFSSPSLSRALERACDKSGLVKVSENEFLRRGLKVGAGEALADGRPDP